MHKLIQGVQLSCSFLALAIKLMLTVMFVIFITLVITRYFFSYSVSWAEEVSRFLLIWISMLGAAVLVLYQDHFALHMLTEKLSLKHQLYHQFIMQFLTLGVCAVIFPESVEFATSAKDVIASGSQISMLYPKLAIPVGLGLMMFYAVVSLIDLGLQIGGAQGSCLPSQKLFMASSFRPSDSESLDDQDTETADSEITPGAKP